jgi:hypothetical protein
MVGSGGYNWNFINKTEYITKEMKKWGQDPTIISDLHQQQQELDTVIADMVQQRKSLENDQTLKWKSAATTRSHLKTIRKAKQKKDKPVFSDIGVDCHELIIGAKPMLLYLF